MAESINIPNDLAGCHALIDQLSATVNQLNQQIAEQKKELEAQQLELNEMIQLMFRKRSERYIECPGQLKLDLGDSPEANDAAEGLAEAVEQAELIIGEHKRRKRQERKPRSEQLPEHLPRYEVPLEVPDEVKNCPEHGERTLIGHDRQETLEFEPPKLKVRVTLIPKYACEGAADCGVSEPQRPPGLVEGNRYDTSIAAEIITGKWGYHLPIYRQQDWFGGSGWMPGRSTLLNIQRSVAESVQPFTQYLRSEVLSSGLLGTDDTRVTLLLPSDIPDPIPRDPKSQRIHEVFTKAREAGAASVSGRMWAYRGITVPINVFDFTVSRHRDGPDQFLVDSGFVGKMMVDCYSGYQSIALRSEARIERAACVAHARRKFDSARENHPLLAAQFLALFQQLYDIEDRAFGMTPEDRQALREREARAIWQRIRELADSQATANLLPKEKIAEALGYLRNHWDELQVYLTDGRLPIDNNEVEQLMKQVAVGRKNWLFTGSVVAGEQAADLLTLVSSAIRNDLNVWAYVKDVLDRLLAGSTDYEALRPDRWAAAHPDQIRTYRAEERRERSDAKRVRRARRRLAKANKRSR